MQQLVPSSSGLADIVLHCVLSPELAHVVHHLAVKVCVVRSFPGIRYSSEQRLSNHLFCLITHTNLFQALVGGTEVALSLKGVAA